MHGNKSHAGSGTRLYQLVFATMVHQPIEVLHFHRSRTDQELIGVFPVGEISHYLRDRTLGCLQHRCGGTAIKDEPDSPTTTTFINSQGHTPKQWCHMREQGTLGTESKRDVRQIGHVWLQGNAWPSMPEQELLRIQQRPVHVLPRLAFVR